MDLALASKLTRPGGGKIVFCAIDGLGGLAREETLRSELEKADITHLDRLAARSEVGLTEVAGPGVTPGPRAGLLAIGGPRSIPALLATPTWHPVPLLVSSVHGREGNAQHFNEQECLRGSLGIMRAVDVMPLLFAHALRLQPYGD